MSDPDAADVANLFGKCDVDASGYLERSELQTLMPNLSEEDVDEILKILDTDGDGRISCAEVVKALRSTNNTQKIVGNNNIGGNAYSHTGDLDMLRSRSRSCNDLSEKLPLDRTLSQFSDDGADSVYLGDCRKNSTYDILQSLDSRNEVCDVYRQLNALEDTVTMQKFQGYTQELINKLKDANQEKKVLERRLLQERREEEARVAVLIEDADAEAKRMEEQRDEKARQLVQLESRYENDRTDMQDEISLLKDELERVRQQKQQIEQQVEKEKSRRTVVEDNLRQLEEERTSAEKSATQALTKANQLERRLQQSVEQREKNDEVVQKYQAELQSSLADQVAQLQLTDPHIRALLRQTGYRELHAELSHTKTKLEVMESRSSIDLELESIPSCVRSPASIRRRTRVRNSQQSSSSEVHRWCSEIPNNISLHAELEMASSGGSPHYDDSPYMERACCSRPNSLDLSLQHHREEFVNGNSAQHEIMDESRSDSIAYSEPAKSSPINPIPSTDGAYRTPSRPSSAKALATTYTPATPSQFIYKVVLVGDACVGKSTFVLQLCKGVFESTLTSTVGIDFYSKLVRINDSTTATLQLWDTAGQERFRSIAASYFRKADGVVLLYDCCSERSFVSLVEWMALIRASADIDDLPVIICGNKIDLREKLKEEGKQVISTEMGQSIADRYGCLFCEFSAKTGENTSSSIERLTSVMNEKERYGLLLHKQGGLQLHTNSKQNKKCC